MAFIPWPSAVNKKREEKKVVGLSQVNDFDARMLLFVELKRRIVPATLGADAVDPNTGPFTPIILDADGFR